jgi:catechol 2,3-dioxygenase-like lactoylglutathione lyase family enzyme
MIISTLALTAFFAATFLTQSTPSAPSLRASMIVLGVADVSRSLKFYRDTLGLSLAPAPGDLPMFHSGDLTIVLNGALSAGSGGFELVFPVESVSAVRKQLSDRGCTFLGDPREVAPNLWAATFSDPDGHRLTLLGAH